MIVLGIDEAGYGPLLGPLVVAGAAFRTADDQDADAAATRIASALRDAGLVVGDSKRVLGAARDLISLERPVLAGLGGPASVDDLLRAAGVDPAARQAVPWYAGDVPFPRRLPGAELPATVARFRRALDDAGVELVALTADVVPERRLNAAFERGNKADALFDVASGIFDRLASARGPDEALVAVFDRHGGRRYYAPHLQRRWPDALTSPLVETPRRSDYRVGFAAGPALVRFEVEADGAWPQVGLASMLAKYLREVFMDLFNAHFAAICPDVAPTAGYVEDGRRWLGETRERREAAGVPDAELVRRR